MRMDLTDEGLQGSERINGLVNGKAGASCHIFLSSLGHLPVTPHLIRIGGHWGSGGKRPSSQQIYLLIYRQGNGAQRQAVLC